MRLELPIANNEFKTCLLDWYQQNKRTLPWREKTDPYHIWVAEVMLQQTQIKTALPYFEKFIQRYPRLEDLALADEDDVLSSWSGLGYYKRARNLRRAAQIVCERHAGAFPRAYGEALSLPGVGPYTAGAVLSMAYHEPLPVLDGNIRRLLARYLKIEQPLEGSVEEALWDLLSQLATDSAIAPEICDFNQALMELGALVCTPRNPECTVCPLSESCGAYLEGLQDSLPLKKRSRSSEELHYVVAVVIEKGKILLKRNETENFLRGLWEFPRVPKTEAEVAQAFCSRHGLVLRVERQVAPITHQITFRRLHFHPVLAALRVPRPPQGCVWVRPGNRKYPVSAYVGKVLRRIEETTSHLSRYNLDH